MSGDNILTREEARAISEICAGDATREQEQLGLAALGRLDRFAEGQPAQPTNQTYTREQQPPALSQEQRERLIEIAAHLDRVSHREHDFQAARQTQEDAAFLRDLANQSATGEGEQ